MNTKGEDNCFDLRKLDSFNLANIGFIKIDAESFEIEIIKGAIETLKNNNYPPLYIELLGKGNDDPVKMLYDKHSQEVVNILIDLGYLMNTPFVAGTSNDYLFIHKKYLSIRPARQEPITMDPTSQLLKLCEMYSAGHLSEAEFRKAKGRLLSGGSDGVVAGVGS